MNVIEVIGLVSQQWLHLPLDLVLPFSVLNSSLSLESIYRRYSFSVWRSSITVSWLRWLSLRSMHLVSLQKDLFPSLPLGSIQRGQYILFSHMVSIFTSILFIRCVISRETLWCLSSTGSLTALPLSTSAKSTTFTAKVPFHLCTFIIPIFIFSRESFVPSQSRTQSL